MPDQRALRKIRMANEYNRLMRMSRPGGILEITGNNGPQSTSYTILFRIPTIIGLDGQGKPVYRNISTVDITIPEDYPQAVPVACMREQQPWHPNWYTFRKWCPGIYDSVREPLWEYVRRMAETIRFNPEFTNPNSAANHDAVEFWNNPENKRYFPTCSTPLPTGDEQPQKARIVIHHI